jgi:hypothetical protein
MIEQEADQSRGERESELRLLAAWTSVLAGRERLPEAQGSRRVGRFGGR